MDPTHECVLAYGALAPHGEHGLAARVHNRLDPGGCTGSGIGGVDVRERAWWECGVAVERTDAGQAEGSALGRAGAVGRVGRKRDGHGARGGGDDAEACVAVPADGCRTDATVVRSFRWLRADDKRFEFADCFRALFLGYTAFDTYYRGDASSRIGHSAHLGGSACGATFYALFLRSLGGILGRL